MLTDYYLPRTVNFTDNKKGTATVNSLDQVRKMKQKMQSNISRVSPLEGKKQQSMVECFVGHKSNCNPKTLFPYQELNQDPGPTKSIHVDHAKCTIHDTTLLHPDMTC